MENENGNFQTWPGIRVTFGEIFPDGVVLDLVESSSGGGVELVRWDGEGYEIAPQVKEGETIYTPGHCTPACSRLPASRAGWQNTGIP